MACKKNPETNDWIFLQKVLLKYFFAYFKQCVEGEQVVGEEFGEFHDREYNLEKNWIFSNRFFIKLVFPFIKQFMEEEIDDFCTWVQWVWEERELLQDYQVLKMEERAVSLLSKKLDDGFAQVIENIRTTKKKKQVIRLRKSFAKQIKKILVTIEKKIHRIEKKIHQKETQLMKGPLYLETLCYYNFIFFELNMDPMNLFSEEDNRLFFFVFHIINVYIDRQLDNLN
uniref:Uncharacterized protein n=1 Tax=Cyphia belfastica TaxID=2041114 RepID=A0A291F2X9_9ASTR|nr:hypothetical protein Cyp_bel1Pt0248 [Cyphia belfastica]ATG26500.1 hypothetical protein Cyp_bel1Pt0248 [Cyphia belfastica]